MLNDPLANVMSMILNGEKLGERTVTVHPASSIIKEVIEILRQKGYVKDWTVTGTARGGTITITLSGNVNKCGVIKPRFSVEKDEIEKFEKRYLPAKGMGILIISTNQGLLTHTAVLEKHTGGRLIAYCY